MDGAGRSLTKRDAAGQWRGKASAGDEPGCKVAKVEAAQTGFRHFSRINRHGDSSPTAVAEAGMARCD